MANHNLPYIVGINCTGVVGPMRYQQLVQAFGSPEGAWRASDASIKALGWGEDACTTFIKKRKTISLEGELRKIKRLGIRVLTPVDKEYPLILKEIPDAPFILYVRGNVEVLSGINIGIVGSRTMTSYGRDVVESLVPDLSLSGLTIVSGLAFGVDYCAHDVTLENGGEMIAVLASGVDNITPASNSALGERILGSGSGAIVSEFSIGTKPQKYFFPFRNRIISGLSLGVIVIEAALRSGTLHTVESALKQGREVFSVPGSIFSNQSMGTNKLINEGARIVQRAQDILDVIDVELRTLGRELKEIVPESVEEGRVLEILDQGRTHIDEIVRILDKPVSEVSSILVNMELKGMVKEESGVYRLAKLK